MPEGLCKSQQQLLSTSGKHGEYRACPSPQGRRHVEPRPGRHLAWSRPNRCALTPCRSRKSAECSWSHLARQLLSMHELQTRRSVPTLQQSRTAATSRHVHNRHGGFAPSPAAGRKMHMLPLTLAAHFRAQGAPKNTLQISALCNAPATTSQQHATAPATASRSWRRSPSNAAEPWTGVCPDHISDALPRPWTPGATAPTELQD